MKNYVREIIRQYISGRYPAQTERSFEQWLVDDTDADTKRAGLKEAEISSLWNDIDTHATDDASLDKICELTGINARRHYAAIARKLRVWRSVAAAAVIVAAAAGLAALFLSTGDRDADLLQAYTPKAEINSITLPDGTQVTVNSKSTIIYPEAFKGPTRSVFLIGEAHFKIKPDKKRPFIVKTAELQVEALGTTFDIEAYPDVKHVKASLVEGSVRVGYHNLQQSKTLRPGDQLVYNRVSHEAAMNRPEMSDVTAWLRGSLVFTDMTPGEIFTQLERKYPYTFLYSPRQLKRGRYTLTFESGASINEIMDAVTSAVGGLRYEIDSDVCRIY